MNSQNGSVLESTLRKEYPEYVKNSRFEKELTDNKRFALDKKYLLRDDDGIIMETPSQAIYRMASTLAEVERQYGKSEEEVQNHTKEFFDMIDNSYFSPAGRIWTNAGTDIKGLFNCYVLPVPDDTAEIFESVKKAAIIHKNGGGTGYNFSELRPRGTYVKKSKGIASGPVSFITQFDRETEIINSGNRRGANMGMLDVNHPDILDFIYAKAGRGEIQNFNVSVGIYDDFMKAAENNEYYNLKFKDTNFTATHLTNIIRNIEENKLGGSDVGKAPKPASLRYDLEKGAKVENGKTKVIDSYSGKIAGRVDIDGNIQLSAVYIMDVIANLAWKTADPGVIFLDRVNEDNPLINTKGPMKATNPCGEQPLHPHDACNLGSIILSNMIKYVQANKDDSVNTRPVIDYDLLAKTVKTALRFQDNVNDANKGPIPQVEQTVLEHRRIGLGVMGWADMLMKLRMKYDSNEAYTLAEEVMGFITKKAKEYSVELATEKEVFPAFKGSTYDDGKLENRVRNVQRTTIAPTGTIAMVFDVASGIEPYFAVSYVKNIRGGDVLYNTIPEFIKVVKERGLDLKELEPLIAANRGSVQGIDKIPKDIQDMFRTAMDIDYKGHVLMQAAFQKVTDNAISKTINMRNEVTVQDIKDAYMFAWKNKLKGTTIYRDGSKDVQVLEVSKQKANALKGTIDDPLKVPDIMPAIKISQRTPEGKLHALFVYDPLTKNPVELFAMLGNAGSSEAANIEAIGRQLSLYLRSGGKLEKQIEQLIHIGTGDLTLTSAGHITSVPMGLGVASDKYLRLMKEYATEDILNGKIDMKNLDAKISESIKNGNTSNQIDSTMNGDIKQPKKSQECPQCGVGTIIKQEGCERCTSCTYSRC